MVTLSAVCLASHSGCFSIFLKGSNLVEEKVCQLGSTLLSLKDML